MKHLTTRETVYLGARVLKRAKGDSTAVESAVAYAAEDVAGCRTDRTGSSWVDSAGMACS